MTADYLLIVAIAVAAYWIIRTKSSKSKRGVSKSQVGFAFTPPQAEPAFDWPSLGKYEAEVVGESHYQPALKAIVGDHGDESANMPVQALLVPEPDNPYDKQAIKVEINGMKVGHLSRESARTFHRRLAAKNVAKQTTRCGAMVTGGWVDKSGQRMSYGVNLDIKPFD